MTPECSLREDSDVEPSAEQPEMNALLFLEGPTTDFFSAAFRRKN